MSFSLSQVKFGHLRASQNSDDLAVLLYSFEISLDGLLGVVSFFVSLGVFSEGSLLGSGPVLVESSLEFIGDFLGPDGRKCSQTSGSFDVSDQTDDFHGWALNDGDWFDDVFLDDFFTFSLFVMSGNVSHTSLVADEGSKVDWLFGVILGERSYSPSVMSGPSLGEEGQRTVSWGFVFSVRHTY